MTVSRRLASAELTEGLFIRPIVQRGSLRLRLGLQCTGGSMPLIKEIETALLFVADLPDSCQRDVARFMSMIVTNHDNVRTMTRMQRRRLAELDLREMERRLREE
jgi:hypothetical protein